MQKLITFFIDRVSLNYILTIFFFIIGIYSYINIPKEIFPVFAMDKITISGSYAGASADILDKMAVSNIEDEVKNITGIEKVESTISAGSFNITLTVSESFKPEEVLDKVKDALSLTKDDLPSDMVEPTAVVAEHKIPLLQVSISSNTLSYDSLVDIAKDVKSKLSSIQNLTDIMIYSEDDRKVEIKLNSQKIEAFGLNKKALIEAISQISYIFPIGKIEEVSELYFISTYNGKKEEDKILNTILKVANKKIYLKDVASVDILYPTNNFISSFNGKKNVNINVAKAKEGNAIALSEYVEEYVKELEKNYDGVELNVHQDTSIYIKNRLNTVSANIFLGLILVTIAMFLLINKRIALIVSFGIPFSFVIAIAILYQLGYSVNMISLIAGLIALGVIVDDAIVVAENIQRYIEEGYSNIDASIKGASEMFMPVTLASLTTIFAFMPMLMMSGEMGNFISLIPIVIIVLLLASLIETFFFLPIHAIDILNRDTKTTSWEKINNYYEKTLRFLVEYKKSFLILFIAIVVFLTIFGLAKSKFELFPKFDGNQVYIAGKLQSSTPIESSYEISHQIEEKILKLKKELFIKDVSAITGLTLDAQFKPEYGTNYFFIFLELQKAKEDNFVENYITPLLLFDFDTSDKIRELKSFEIANRVREILSGQKEKFNLLELDVLEGGAGLVKADIELSLSSPNREKILTAIDILEKELTKIDGVRNINDNAEFGSKEIKLKVNEYGESLGVNETYIATILSDFFLSARHSKSFNDEGIIEITTEDINKDRLKTLKSFNISLPSGEKVRLSEITDFITISNFKKIVKEDSLKIREVFANVDSDIITATEVLKKLKPTFEKLKEFGVEIKLKGEAEKKSELLHDMSIASFIALFLMFISLLIMFNSIKYVLLILSVIPFSLLGILIGHYIMGLNLTMPSMIGILGLAGVVINDGIIMIDFIRRARSYDEFFKLASMRFRPIILTSLTTLIGLSTLIFFPSGQAKILQPLAISLGFGLAWGTVLNLLYLPTLFAVTNGKLKKDVN